MTDSPCFSAVELLAELERAERSSHFSSCPDCAARLAESLELRSLARELPWQPPAAAQVSELRARLLLAATTKRRWQPGAQHWGFAAAAALVLGLLGTLRGEPLLVRPSDELSAVQAAASAAALRSSVGAGVAKSAEAPRRLPSVVASHHVEHSSAPAASAPVAPSAVASLLTADAPKTLTQSERRLAKQQRDGALRRGIRPTPEAVPSNGAAAKANSPELAATAVAPRAPEGLERRGDVPARSESSATPRDEAPRTQAPTGKTTVPPHDAASERRAPAGAAPERREAAGERREAASQRRDATKERRETGGERREQAQERRDVRQELRERRREEAQERRSQRRQERESR